jgi:TfoX N-terminal domain
MAWQKSKPELVARFDAALPDDPRVERRKMFGYPAGFVNGNLFAGLHEQNVVVRLPGGLPARLRELADAAVFDPMGTGKGMKDWWVVPPAIARERRALARALAAVFAAVSKLPPKAKSKAKPKVSASARS